MTILLTKKQNKQVALGAIMSVLFFATTAVQTYAMTDAERLSHMGSQLNVAEAALKRLVALKPSGLVLGASSVSAELQAQIKTLEATIKTIGTPSIKAEIEAQIKMLQAQIGIGKDQTTSPVVPAPMSKVPFFKASQTAKTIAIGEQDTSIAKIAITKAKGERYLNKVAIRVAPGVKNGNKLPWESFSEISIFVGSYKVKATDVRDASKWKTIVGSNGGKTYEFMVFDGNQKLPATLKKEVAATLSVTSTDSTENKDAWMMWVPKDGITLWTPTQKHMKYGPTKVFRYTMVGEESDDEDSDEVVPASEVKITSGRATIKTVYLSPFTVRVTGTYNDIKSCDAGLKYVVDYSDGTSDTFVTDDSCKKVSFSKTHTFTEKIQRNYNVQIELYAVHENNWTHFVQSASLVRVNANGSLTTEKNDIATWKKG